MSPSQHDSTATPVDRTTRRPPLARARAVGMLFAVQIASLVALSAWRVTFEGTALASDATTPREAVVVDDDGDGSILFGSQNLAPGAPASECVNVTYTGALDADVRLFGDAGGSALAPFLDFTVESGTGAAGGPAHSCKGFAPGDVLFDGLLSEFAASKGSFDDGVRAFAASTGATRSYRITTTLHDDDRAQHLGLALSLTWEARSR